MRRASQVHKENTPNTRLQPRSRDDKKSAESNKQKSTTSSTSEETQMESSKATAATEDVYEFKKEADSPEQQKSSGTGAGENVNTENETVDSTATTNVPAEDSLKRNFSETQDGSEESQADEESRRKKRKDDGKDGKANVPQRNSSQGKQTNKQGSTAQNKAAAQSTTKGGAVEKKSPVASPKPASTSDAEVEDGKTDLKVPPLKIVIPQGSSGEPESGPSRNGKSSSQRSHQALPYVVASSSNEVGEKDGNAAGGGSPAEASSTKAEEKKETGTGSVAGDEQRTAGHQRVLRSSHKSGAPTDRSNNSSPQLQSSHSPSPSASSSPSAPTPNDCPANSSGAFLPKPAADTDKASTDADSESATSSTANAPAPTQPSVVELHPRKRKMKQSKEASTAQQSTETPETPAVSEVHPHEQPITNCYQLYLNIRKQIEKRRKGLFPVQPKPPQGFKDYLMNRCAYVLAGTAPTTPNIIYPPTLPPLMKEFFAEQEKERYKLRMRHIIEKEKLVLAVEQEILRVHGRAARALANQSLPFSVCTILRDEEVYNLITPEQEEKDRNNLRSRYNGRLFLSWLQDVDDKWEKIKEPMICRHHNEADSLYSFQKMNWEWKLKELSLCDSKSTPHIDETHVPILHVSDDFDLMTP